MCHDIPTCKSSYRTSRPYLFAYVHTTDESRFPCNNRIPVTTTTSRVAGEAEEECA